MEPEAIVNLVALAAAAAATVLALEALNSLVRRRKLSKTDLNLTPLEIEIASQAIREDFSEGVRGDTSQSGASEPLEPLTPAEVEALAIMKVYGKELMAESNRIARRASAERPSKKHVRQAADRIGVLRDRAGVASDLTLALGSILVGASVSYQVNLWTGGEAAPGSGLWVSLALAVGVGIIVAAATVKWRRT